MLTEGESVRKVLNHLGISVGALVCSDAVDATRASLPASTPAPIPRTAAPAFLPLGAADLAMDEGDDVYINEDGLAYSARPAMFQPAPVATTPYIIGMGGSGVAVDSTNVYWGDDAIYSSRRGSGTAVRLAPFDANLYAMVSDGTALYWVDDGGLWSVPLPAGAPRQLLGVPKPYDPDFVRLAVDDTNLYYAWNGPVMKIPKAGGAPMTLVPGVTVAAVAVDSSGVYFLERESRSISRVAASGGAPTVLVSNLGTPRSHVVDLALDATALYFTIDCVQPIMDCMTGDGAVMRLAK